MVNKAHRHHDVIIAWANGAEIECRDYPSTRWEHCAKPTWHELGEYRVKPEPPAHANGYDVFLGDGSVLRGVADLDKLREIDLPDGPIMYAISGSIFSAEELGERGCVEKMRFIVAADDKKAGAVEIERGGHHPQDVQVP